MVFFDQSSLARTAVHQKKVTTETIPMVTIDSVVGEIPIGVVKIDVQGFEYEVIQGMKKMLENSPPNYVEQRSKAVGVFLIAADAMTFVLFFMSGVLCIVWLFRSWKAAEVEETKKNKSDSGVHRRCRLRKKSTMVVPVPLPMVVMPKELALSAATEIRTWSLDQAKDKEKENNST